MLSENPARLNTHDNDGACPVRDDRNLWFLISNGACVKNSVIYNVFVFISIYKGRFINL